MTLVEKHHQMLQTSFHESALKSPAIITPQLEEKWSNAALASLTQPVLERVKPKVIPTAPGKPVNGPSQPHDQPVRSAGPSWALGGALATGLGLAAAHATGLDQKVISLASGELSKIKEAAPSASLIPDFIAKASDWKQRAIDFASNFQGGQKPKESKDQVVEETKEAAEMESRTTESQPLPAAVKPDATPKIPAATAPAWTTAGYVGIGSLVAVALAAVVGGFLI
jgi:hypothetical protein